MSRLSKLHILHRIYLQRAAVYNGLYSGQPQLLEYVARSPGCTQAELVEFLQVTPPCIATSVKRLQKAGLITKEEDAIDMRRSNLYLTPLGEKKSQKCQSEFDRIDSQIFQDFTSEEISRFYSYLDRMLSNLSTEEFEGKSFRSLVQTAKELEQQRPAE